MKLNNLTDKLFMQKKSPIGPVVQAVGAGWQLFPYHLLTRDVLYYYAQLMQISNHRTDTLLLLKIKW